MFLSLPPVDNFNIFTIPSALKHANNTSDNLNVNSICSCVTAPDHSHFMNWNNSHCQVLMMVTTFTSEILVWVTHFPWNTAAPCCQSQDSHHPRSKGTWRSCFQKQLHVFSVDAFCTTEMPLMIALLLEVLWFTVPLKMDEKKKKPIQQYNSL